MFTMCPLLLLSQSPELKTGTVITESVSFEKNDYLVEPADSNRFNTPEQRIGIKAAITIEGDGLVIDFAGSDIHSGLAIDRPDQFYGLGIIVKGKNIVIRNLNIRGYKIALYAKDADGLTLENCDFSYNYRPRLNSIREREDFSDWLSYHQNDSNEWMRYGAGLYLEKCDSITVKGCTATSNQNALLLTNCNDGLIFNNTFQFNSGLGMGLYRSSRNTIMHNYLDWNIRGYSHGFYKRGQDSAAILVYEQSNENTIAFNSGTHSGDGLFLWAGQHTMDTGEGGCNDNIIFGNDFSYAATNGIEATFSRNRIQGNTLQECTYGIWAGYSYRSSFRGNALINCETGLAIEHGQHNEIKQNLFLGDSTGIRLWTRGEQPSDWGYVKHRDTRNLGHLIDRNVFQFVRNPLRFGNSDSINVNGENLFIEFKELLLSENPNTNLKFYRNELFANQSILNKTWENPDLSEHKGLNFSNDGPPPDNPYYPLDIEVGELNEPAMLPGGQVTSYPKNLPRGRQNIVVDEWGPYRYDRPLAYLLPDQADEGAFELELKGPARGLWEIVEMKGLEPLPRQNGQFPARFGVKKKPGAKFFKIVFHYQGPEPVTTEFGEIREASREKPFEFTFERFEKKLNWEVSFFNYDDASDPLKNEKKFDRLVHDEPVHVEKTNDLYYAWWGAPAEGVNADRFATVCWSDTEWEEGEYEIRLSSDDGVRLYINGSLLIDRWDVHEPSTDTIRVKMKGRRGIRIEHFEAGGFGTLGFSVKRLD